MARVRDQAHNQKLDIGGRTSRFGMGVAKVPDNDAFMGRVRSELRDGGSQQARSDYPLAHHGGGACAP